METNELIRNLENVIERYKDKQVGVGQIRIDYLAGDCLRKIRELVSEVETAKKEG